jgi:hypothetical protein
MRDTWTKPLALGRRRDGLRRQNEQRFGAPGEPGLERILNSKLYLARRPSAFNFAEIGAVGDVAVRVQELSGVEEIKEFRPELDGLALLELRVLLDGEVKVLDASATTY